MITAIKIFGLVMLCIGVTSLGVMACCTAVVVWDFIREDWQPGEEITATYRTAEERRRVSPRGNDI